MIQQYALLQTHISSISLIVSSNPLQQTESTPISLTFSQRHTDGLVLRFPSLPMPHQAASAMSTGMFMTVH